MRCLRCLRNAVRPVALPTCVKHRLQVLQAGVRQVGIGPDICHSFATMSEHGQDVGGEAVRRVRVHKAKRAQPAGEQPTAQLDARVSELVSGIADLSVAGATSSARQPMPAPRRLISRDEAKRATLAELSTIFDMSTKNPVDDVKPDPRQPFQQQLRPQPKRIQLSQYQVEMINYQRMLLRKNIWYYRDRMNNPRGPCPLHTLKDAWVQGVIDENTLVWGQGLYDWLPAKNVKLLLAMIRTPEVRFGAWLKKTFSLKPALNRIREMRAQERPELNHSKQVDRMR